MKDNETKQKFIELRAKGLSFDKISNELNVSKQTLITWQSEFVEEINNLKAMELEALYEQFYLQKQDRIERFGKLLDRLHNEIELRDLKEVDTDKLINLYLKVYSNAISELDALNFKDEQDIKTDKLARQNLKTLAERLTSF
jgi:transcriptional regulator with XRE-family HTH domain